MDADVLDHAARAVEAANQIIVGNEGEPVGAGTVGFGLVALTHALLDVAAAIRAPSYVGSDIPQPSDASR